MSEPIVAIDGEHRPMTDAEIVEYETYLADLKERQKQNAAKEAARAAALAKLGLTDDEIAALFG